MAKAQFVVIPDELRDQFKGSFQLGDRFTFGTIKKARLISSRNRKAQLAGQSIFKVVSVLWKTLSQEERDAWIAVASANGWRSGWVLFVHDQAARLRFQLEGSAEPVDEHQGWVGNLFLDTDDEIKITQLHPKNYWVSRPVPGFRNMREPVLVTEDFALPLTIQLSYSSDLEVTSGETIAKFYAEVWHSYQGQDLRTVFAIDLSIQTDWVVEDLTISNVLGHIIRYDLFFHIKGYTGNVWFDNIESEHSGQNWVRDPRCDDISKTFPKVFFQIPAHWAAVTLPDGVAFNSTYRDF